MKHFGEIVGVSWSVASVKPGALSLAEVNLQRQQFEFYSPKIIRKVRDARGCYGPKKFQLFPGYLFVFVIDRWRSLLSTFGINGVLMDQERPAVLRDGVIEAIRAREADGVVVLQKSKFRQGQRVRVISGPLMFELGIYEGQRERDRVSVLMQLLGRPVRATFKEDNLAAA